MVNVVTFKLYFTSESISLQLHSRVTNIFFFKLHIHLYNNTSSDMVRCIVMYQLLYKSGYHQIHNCTKIFLHFFFFKHFNILKMVSRPLNIFMLLLPFIGFLIILPCVALAKTASSSILCSRYFLLLHWLIFSNLGSNIFILYKTFLLLTLSLFILYDLFFNSTKI